MIQADEQTHPMILQTTFNTFNIAKTKNNSYHDREKKKKNYNIHLFCYHTY